MPLGFGKVGYVAEVVKVIKKICVFGDPAVGKTSLIQRYVFDVFNNAYYPTIGTKVLKSSAEVMRGEYKILMTTMLWDLLGQSKFEAIHRTYYQGAEGGITVCDVSRPETIQNLGKWVEDFRATVGPVPVIMLANKTDLLDPSDTTTKRKVEDAAKRNNLKFLFTSAKNNENVHVAFQSMAEEMADTVKKTQ